jgi:hypothetical protein
MDVPTAIAQKALLLRGQFGEICRMTSVMRYHQNIDRTRFGNKILKTNYILRAVVPQRSVKTISSELNTGFSM